MTTNETSMPVELQDRIPLYQSHKVVRALKIKDVIEEVSTPNWVALQFDNFPELNGTLAIRVANKPRPKSGWYYVLYEDGYESFSPPEAFKQGYSPHVPEGLDEPAKKL
jgi:hypothetical protein